MIRLTSVIGSKDYSFGKATYEESHTPNDRYGESKHIDYLASEDPIYLAGVEAASVITLRFIGIPIIISYNPAQSQLVK